MNMKRVLLTFVLLSCSFVAVAPAGAATPFTRLITAGTSEYNDTAIVLQNGSGVVFHTSSALVPEDDDPTPQRDVYLNKDGAITLLTPGIASSVSLDLVGASDDGSVIFVETTGAFDPTDNDGSGTDVYEIQNGQEFLVSTSEDGSNTPNSQARFAGNSPDGKTLYYTTDQQMVDDDLDGGGEDVYAFTRTASGTKTKLISTSGVDDPQNNVDAEFCGASDDGSVVAFQTTDELLGGDNDGSGQDTYRFNNGDVTLASTGPNETDLPGNQDCVGVSGDGTAVAFESTVRLFAADDAINARDVFTYNGVSTRWVSTSSNDVSSDEHAFFGDMSWDGDTVYFNTSDAMIAADTDSADVDGYSLSPGGTFTLLTAGDLEPDTSGARIFRVSKDGSTVLITTNDSYVSEDADLQDGDLYIRVNGGPMTFISTGPVDLDASVNHTPLFNSDPLLRKWTMSADGGIIGWYTNDLLTSDDLDNDYDVYAYVTPKDPPATPVAAPTPTTPPDAAPSITSPKLNRSKFAVNKKGKALKSAAAKKGATLSFSLSEAATIVGTVYSCRKLVKTKCTGKKKTAAFKLTGKSGKNSASFSGKIGRKTLKTGGHLLELVATDPIGQKSSKRSLGFTLVKP